MKKTKFIAVITMICIPFLLWMNVSAYALENASHLKLLSTLGYGYINDLAYTQDGNSLFVSSATGIQIYNAQASGEPPQILTTEATGKLAFSPDGKLLAAAQNETVIWNLAKREKIATLKGIAPVFSLDGKLIVTADKQNVLLWDVGTQHQINSFATQLEIRQLAFTNDPREILLRDPSDISLWSLNTGTRILTFENKAQGLDEMAVSSNGKIAAAAGFNSNGIWNTKDGSVIRITDDWWDPAQQAVAFNSDGTLVAFGDANGYVGIEDITTGEIKHSFPHQDEVSHLAFSPDTSIAIAGIDGIIDIWDLNSDKKVGTLQKYARKPDVLKFSQNDSLLVSASLGGTIWRWDVQSNQQLSINQGYQYGATHGTYPYPMTIAISPDANLLATGESIGGVIRLWTPNGKSRGSFEIGLGNDVYNVAFSADGTKIAAVSFGHIYFWKIRTGERLTGLLPTQNKDKAISIVFSPNGQILAEGTFTGAIYLQDVTTGHFLHTLQGHDGDVRNQTFSPDGKILATTSYCYECKPNDRDYGIWLWDVKTGTLINVLEGHTDFVQDLKFSSTGNILASTANDGTIRLWDVASGKQIDMVERGAKVLAFDHKGDILASGNVDGTISLWLFSPN